MGRKSAFWATAAILLAAALSHAQFVSSAAQSHPGISTNPVQYLFPEQVTLPAGKVSPVTLHFRIAPGMHVNSHTPSDEFLIPTVLSLPEGTGVKLAATNYPPGTNITLPADPKTKLNVYTGDFNIDVRLVASAGDHLVQARLRYQACNDQQCLPPKTITVPVDVIGK